MSVIVSDEQSFTSGVLAADSDFRYIQESVSAGDVSSPAAGVLGFTVDDVVAAMEGARFQAVVTVSADYSLFDKPLDQYTPTEGMLLIIVLCLVGICVSKIIGGVLNCKLLFGK